MTFSEIIIQNRNLILDYYLNQKLKKSHIAYKIIKDLDLDLNVTQVDSFRRMLTQYISDWHLTNPDAQAPIITEGETLQLPQEKYSDAVRTRAKVLLLDTETAPLIIASWGVRKQHINIDQVISDSHLICWAGKWLFEPEVFGDCITPEEAIAKNDKRICQSLWDALDEADIIIAHNGKRFDIKVINGRFFINKMKVQPSPYEVIDTLESADRAFRLSSHKLDFINRVSGLTVKIKTDFQLWLDCMKGIPERLLEMYTYCKNDTSILEETYMEMRPWIKAHPNMAFYVESDNLICPTCGHTEVEERGTYRTGVNEYISFSCPKCGAQGRSRKSSTTLTKKQSVLVSLGR